MTKPTPKPAKPTKAKSKAGAAHKSPPSRKPSAGLSPKQQRFVDEYLVDLNATQAAIRAGYSPGTAGAIGFALLQKAEIEAGISAARQKQQQMEGAAATARRDADHELAHVKIQMDAAQRKEAAGKAAAAIAAGDYSVAADFYNRYVPSGAKVTGIEAGKDGQLVINRTGLDGKPEAPMTIKTRARPWQCCARWMTRWRSTSIRRASFRTSCACAERTVRTMPTAGPIGQTGVRQRHMGCDVRSERAPERQARGARRARGAGPRDEP